MIEKLTPLETVRAYCVQCLGMKQFNTDEIKNCEGDLATFGTCPFFPYRLGKRPPVKVFRKFCLECQGGRADFVRTCPIENCECYPYRMGKNAARAGKGQSAERMAVVRLKKQAVSLKFTVQNQRSANG